MKVKPKIFNWLAVAMGLIAVSFPAQIMFLYGHTFSEMGAVFAKLTPLNFAVMLLSVVCAWHVHRASPRIKYIVPLFAVTVIYNNFLVAAVGFNYSVGQVWLSTLGFLGLVSLLLTPDARSVITNPNRRWWMIPERKQISKPVSIMTPDGVMSAHTFDISVGGAFLCFDQKAGFPSKSTIKMGQMETGDEFDLSLNLGKNEKISCKAQVVRKGRAKGNYPAGVGVRFLDIESQDTKKLGSFVSH